MSVALPRTVTSAGMSSPGGRVAVTPRGPRVTSHGASPAGSMRTVQGQRVIEWAGRTAGGLRVGAVDGRLMGLAPRPEGQRAGSGQEREARQVAGRVAQRLH